MKRKLTCLFLALALLLQLGVTAFASEAIDCIATTAKLQIAPADTEITSSTPSSASVSKSTSDNNPKFDYLYTLDMQNVRDKFTRYYNIWSETIDHTVITPEEIHTTKVSGSFEAEIRFPKNFVVPSEFLKNGEMIGFDDNAKLVFGNDIRTLEEGANENVLKIQISLLGKENNGSRPGYVLIEELKNNLGTYLADFTIKCAGVEVTSYGTFIVTGKMAGTTTFTSEDLSLAFDYKTEPEITTANCSVVQSGTAGAATGISYTVSFLVDGDSTTINAVKIPQNAVLKTSELPIPHKEGYSFDGWYTDSDLQNKVTEDITITGDVTLYGSWKKTPRAKNLNDTDHFAYISGYPDGTVRPNDEITREEVATIFFRLLRDEERTNLLSKTNNFSDVASNRWSNTAISTMANGGFITGYTDGTFGPQKHITRAEFVTIAYRLVDLPVDAAHNFSDISGHWAEEYVANAFVNGWTDGYSDQTFRPDQSITRAEAIAIINRILNRFVIETGIHKDATIWPDNPKGAWYYFYVEEATNSHEYERPEGGMLETWTAIKENKDWSKMES